eukprot:6559257-Pyramimonas_sp.AAC.1
MHCGTQSFRATRREEPPHERRTQAPWHPCLMIPPARRFSILVLSDMVLHPYPWACILTRGLASLPMGLHPYIWACTSGTLVPNGLASLPIRRRFGS